MWVLINALCKPNLGALGYVTKILHAEGKKPTNLNRYISVITDIEEKWLVIFEHTINHLSFGYVRLQQLEYCFSCFASLVFSFFSFAFPSATIYFKPLNALYSNFRQLKISRGLLCDRNWGVRLGDSPQSSPAKF